MAWAGSVLVTGPCLAVEVGAREAYVECSSLLKVRKEAWNSSYRDITQLGCWWLQAASLWVTVSLRLWLIKSE